MRKTRSVRLVVEISAFNLSLGLYAKRKVALFPTNASGIPSMTAAGMSPARMRGTGMMGTAGIRMTGSAPSLMRMAVR